MESGAGAAPTDARASAPASAAAAAPTAGAVDAGGSDAASSSASAPSSAEVAEAVARARIEWSELAVGEELGRGTHTVVHAARYRRRGAATAEDEAVAVKVLDTEASAETRGTFKVEVEVVLGKLGRHANILNYYGWGVRAADGCQFLVMELFAEGGPVSRRRRRVAEKPRHAYCVMLQVARALAFMHARRLIHRDLKSSNVLVNKHFSTAKLTDFGVSRTALSESASGRMTATTGTFQWMAPEVIAGQSYSYKADVYSFGVLFNELLTGKAPFEEAYLTPVQAATAVALKGMRPRLARSGGEVPACVPELIQRCWSHSPAERPTTVELEQALTELNARYGKERTRGGGGGEGGEGGGGGERKASSRCAQQ